MIVLGIETSCDETAAAVVSGDPGGERRILADVVRGQIEAHRAWGGVVPELAARAHIDVLDHVIARAMADAGLGFDQLDGIAATGGPGLIGGVIVGVTMAKAIALAHNRPFLAINHLEGHALTARLTDDVAFPYLLLLVSGGHCQLLIVLGVGRYQRLGTTVDDALGEAFDKVAKVLDLGFPGGPAVERLAQSGDPRRFALPRPMVGRDHCHFSFSGLKTAVKRAWDSLTVEGRTPQARADLAAAFQAAAADVLSDRTDRAIAAFRRRFPAGDTVVVAGGVAANAYIRARLADVCRRHRLRLSAPPARLCTDNGVMIAWAGIERLRHNLTDPFDFAPRPRWPLDPAAPPVAFAGIKA